MKQNSLGFDSSNYTTSAAYLCGGEIRDSRKLLPVKNGEKGLRQSDAVFLHVKQYPEIIQGLGDISDTDCVGVSVTPRNSAGSYMPCFLVGRAAAEAAAASAGVPLYEFSHQQGHIAAGLMSCHAPELLDGSFYAFHVSGGTTEMLLVNGIDNISIVACTLDLTCGQLIDRTGVMLGLDFPCGKQLELYSESGSIIEKPHVILKGCDCCLSGYENKIQSFYDAGVSVNDIAQYLFEVVAKTIAGMVAAVLEKHGVLPCLFVGGVMANKYIRQSLSNICDAYFAEPRLSGDNAVGIAYLAQLRHNGVIR